MKFSDIDKNLTEGPLSGPAGFKKRVKAKAQKHLTPFMKGQQERGALKDEQYKKAKQIKQKFKAWKDEIGMSPKVYPTMQEFLQFLKTDIDPQISGLSAAVEQVARSEAAYKEFFTTAIDDKGNATQTASDPKVKVRKDDDIDATGTKAKQVDAPEKEAELELEPEEEVEEEVDMSASIYESRLRAFLSEDGEDVGVNNNKQLADNQIDTLIVKGLQNLRKGGGQASAPASKDDEVSKTADKVSKAKAPDDDEELSVASPSSGGSSFDEFADDIEEILDTIRRDKELSKVHKRNAEYIYKQLFL